MQKASIGRIKDESTRWTQKLEIGRYHQTENNNRSYIVENVEKVYKRNSDHLAPLHHPLLPQFHQSEQSFTEMPSKNENPGHNSSQVHPHSSNVNGQTYTSTVDFH